MHKAWLLMTVLAMFSLVVSGMAFGAGGGEARPVRRAILLVAFGTRIPEAQKAFDQIDARVRAAFPGVDVRWAYTSGVIRAKLAAEGQHLDSPESALAKLMDELYTHVAVLSLHVIPGSEFHDLQRNVSLFGRMAGGFEKIEIAMPLIASHDDMVRVARALMKQIPPERKPEDAVIFAGHGSGAHPADATYAAMDHVLNEEAGNVYMGTVQGYPSIEEIIPKLVANKVRKVWLIPFMTVAGDHARNDIAGEKPESWKSLLTKNGIAAEAVFKGMGQYPEVVEVWIDHLREAISKL